MNFEVLAYIATLLNLFMLTPQVVTTWKTRDTKSFSLLSQSMFLVACILWTIYGISIQAIPVIFANVIAAIHLAILVLLKLRYH